MELFDDQDTEFVGLLDRSPAGPGEDPVEDLIEAVDDEAQGDAAVLVTFDRLGGVPGGFGDQVGGVAGESDLDVVGPVPAIDAPCVPEVGLEVEIGRDDGSRSRAEAS